MTNHETKAQVLVRSFGSCNRDSHAVWPLDEVRIAGFDVTPGFVVDIQMGEKCTSSELYSAIEKAFPSIVDKWKLSILCGLGREERALVQIWTCPAMVSAHDSFVITNLEYSNAQAAAHESESALETLRDLNALCFTLQPTFMERLTDLQNETLRQAQATRIWQLTGEQIWIHINKIFIAYYERTGIHLPQTPVDQLKLAMLQFARQPRHKNARAVEAGCLASFAVRYRPLRLLPPALGSGVVLCGPATEQLSRRGSYAPNIGIDCLESGAFQIQPIEDILYDTTVSQTFDNFNSVCINTLGGYYRVSFILVDQRIIVDTIPRIVPTAEMLFASTAARIQQGLAAPNIEDITQAHVRSILYSRLRLIENDNPVGKGIPAAPGACSGVLSTSFDSATHFHSLGLPVVYCASSPTPEALRALQLSEGAIFRTGGVTSHAAVIARGLGKPCILGIAGMDFVQNNSQEVRIAKTVISDGQWVSIDGTEGCIFLGRREIDRTPLTTESPLFQVLASCDAVSQMHVYVNADNADEAKEGFLYGARGIGLCRIEHMLASPILLTQLGRALTLGLSEIDTSAELFLTEMRSMIWNHSDAALRNLRSCRHNATNSTSYQCFIDALTELKGGLKEQICNLFAIAEDRPVTIRFLDPPLSEFMSESLIDELAKNDSITSLQAENVKRILNTSGGMLGLRGIRLGLILSEFTEMQAMAIHEAALKVSTVSYTPLVINLMAPLISDPVELQLFRLLVNRCLSNDSDKRISPIFHFGAMIETPRAAMIAGDLAGAADFLSFGTNDLSQFVWACSRDSAETDYLRRLPYSAIEHTPFSRFDEKGVGAIMAHATKQAKRIKPIPIGVCGEHARDEKAVRFFAGIGIDYISCAPFAVPEARLAVAQAKLSTRMTDHAQNSNLY